MRRTGHILFTFGVRVSRLSYQNGHIRSLRCTSPIRFHLTKRFDLAFFSLFYFDFLAVEGLSSPLLSVTRAHEKGAYGLSF